MVTNYMAGETLEGGSTIDQQTVKNIFLSPERTMSRKIEELALAVQLDRYYTKQEILELYLNTIYFGHGAYGLREASHTYFGKEPKELDLSQCAMLAGLPQAPSAYDPIDHPSRHRAHDRRPDAHGAGRLHHARAGSACRRQLMASLRETSSRGF